MRLASLGGRLLAASGVWLIVALAGGGVALSYAFRESAEVAFEERLGSLLLSVIASMELRADGALALARPIAEPRFDQVYSGWYWQIADETGPLLRSRSLWDETLPHPIDDSIDALRRRTVEGPRGESVRSTEQRLTLPGRERPLFVTVAAVDRAVQAEIARFDRLLFLSLGGLALGLVAAVLLQITYGLHPLRALAAELDRVRSGETDRLLGRYPAEVDPLVHSMNEVLEHDRRSIERARTHVGNLAHGLKTPLAIVRAEISRPGARTLEIVAEQVSAMERFIQHHLARAAAAASARATGVRTPVKPVLRELRDGLLRIHAERRLDIHVEASPGIVFVGERQDLEEILGNLLDNACKWARSRIVARAQGQSGIVEVVIEDDGPGLAAEDARIALERGQRIDDGRPGSGLGLAIARDLAVLYGGTIRLESRVEGGLRAVASLPGAGKPF